MNGKLWLRKWKILIADKNDNEALNVSELHCTFEVHKSRDKNGFYATCKIYNLTAATEKQLIDEGDRLIIEAGYSTTVQENAGDIYAEAQQINEDRKAQETSYADESQTEE